MAIQVECPNGHKLKVKDKYAGQTGRCPHCTAPVAVPELPPVGNFEDEILALVGPPDRKRPLSPLDDELPVHQEVMKKKDGDSGGESGMSLLGSSIVKHKKTCGNCRQQVLFWYATCPHCNTAFSELPPREK